MGSGRRITRLLLLLSAIGLAGLDGCKSAPEEVAIVDLSPPPPQASAKPVDHLGPDELLEGPDKAFGLVLPKDIAVERVFEDVVYATGSPRVKAVVEYLRPRLREGGFHQTGTNALFERVKIPGAPDREFEIKVSRVDGHTRVEVRDATPRPVPDLPDEESRWRQVGLTKEGKFIDPTHAN